MKISFFIALAVLTATATSLQASDKTTETKKVKPAVKKAKADQHPGPYREKGAVLTGSYLKRDVKRQGVVTDGPNPVYVLDSRAIELSGAADLSQVLIRTGFRR